MKMYPDLTVEGTPEECAAFKHIDAALSARKPRPKAIEGPKPAAKKVPSKRVGRPKGVRKGPPINELAQQVIALALAKDGITTNEVAEYFEIDKKTSYNRLYAMREKGLLWQTGEGVFKAHRSAEYTVEPG